MKNPVLPLFFLILSLQACAPRQQVLDLEASQRMCISGKGPGQDAAINPYYGQNSRALVRNLGTSSMSIRLQKAGEIVKIYELPGKQKVEILLNADQQLFFDSEDKARVDISFRRA